MDDFIIYGNDFQKALENLEKVLIHCQGTHLALNNEKLKMVQIEGIVLGDHVSQIGIKIGPAPDDNINSSEPRAA